MSIAQVNGSSVTQNSTKNNGGAGINLGSSNNLANKSSGQNNDRVGSIVSNTSEIDPALSNGIFAFDNNRPVGKKITDSLASVNNDYLLSGAAEPGLIRSINSIEEIRTRQFTSSVRNKTYDYVNNVFEEGFPVLQLDDLGDDYGGRFGAVAFKIGKSSPVTEYYFSEPPPPSPSVSTNRLLTENSNALTTESGDSLIQE
jgi:hypothetical protein